MRTHKLKRLLTWVVFILVAGLIGTLLWEAQHPPDIRLEASRAAVIAYGRVVSDGSRPSLVIEQIWRHSPTGDPIVIGSSYPSKMPKEAHTDAAIVFFSQGGSSPNLIIAVYGDQIPTAKMSLQDFKTFCESKPGT